MEGWYSLSGSFPVYLSLWATCLLFLLPVKRRGRFPLRAALGLVFAVGAGIVSSLHPPKGIWPELIGCCIICFLFVWFCGAMTLPQALYCTTWALIIQQLVMESWLLIFCVMSDTFGGAVIYMILGIIFYAAAYTAVHFTFCRWLAPKEKYVVGPRKLTAAMILLVIFQICFRILIYNSFPDNLLILAAFLPAQFYCIATLYLQHALFQNSDMRQELEMLNRLWYEQREQYNLAQEHIAVINRKCHDLKHQMAAMRTMVSPENQEKYLSEIDRSIRIYESVVNTGNHVWDTLLTEKSLLCDAKGITINCVADGSCLEFIDPVDLYTILGNVLDNAVEGVQGFQTKDRRIVDVLICNEKEFVIIQIVNPMDANLKLEDGLPVTTKKADGYHGYGLKSISHSVKKYGGYLRVKAENNRFSLKIMMPLDG